MHIRSGIEKTVSGALHFLGLEEAGKIDYHIINPNKSVRFFSLHRLIKTPPGGLKKLVRVVIPFKRVRHSLMSLLFKQNIRIRKRKQMDISLRGRLKLNFVEDIKDLSKIINRDLSTWL